PQSICRRPPPVSPRPPPPVSPARRPAAPPPRRAARRRRRRREIAVKFRPVIAGRMLTVSVMARPDGLAGPSGGARQPDPDGAEEPRRAAQDGEPRIRHGEEPLDGEPEIRRQPRVV